MYQAFEPFRQAGRELALVSRHYTRAAVLDLASGKIIAEETEDPPGSGFCPIGFYVPDWWDIHDASTIPGSEYWNADDEWPLGDFGFVWGCHWGDDTSWKVQYLDLRRVHDGIIGRDDRFGYVKLATTPTVGSASLIFDSSTVGSAHATPSLPPAFIDVQRHAGKTRVRFNVELDFDLESGVVDADDLSGMNRSRA
ncbi:hypothetical protein [Labilithrix luteola]|nr:hypothetical protein [Labilithrix luteola]